MTTAKGTEISLDKIVDLIRATGFEAYVEQTGGGTATIYAGSVFTDAEGDPRYPVVAGPGWFEGPTDARGHTADFCVGPDDDHGDFTYALDAGLRDEADVANLIVEHLLAASATTTAATS